jgi:hypothetical protein
MCVSLESAIYIVASLVISTLYNNIGLFQILAHLGFCEYYSKYTIKYHFDLIQFIEHLFILIEKSVLFTKKMFVFGVRSCMVCCYQVALSVSSGVNVTPEASVTGEC